MNKLFIRLINHRLAAYSCLTLSLMLAACLPMSSPHVCLDRIVSEAQESNPGHMWRYFTSETKDVVAEYQELAKELRATNAPLDPMAVFMVQMRAERPSMTACHIDGNKATTEIRYLSGTTAKLQFVRENNSWRLDLAAELLPSLQLLRQAQKKIEALQTARDNGMPLPRDDDD